MPSMKTCRRVFAATLTAAALTAFGGDDEWVFEGDITRDSAVTRYSTLDGEPFVSLPVTAAAVNGSGEFIRSTWAEEPSNVVYGLDSTIVPGFLLFMK